MKQLKIAWYTFLEETFTKETATEKQMYFIKIAISVACNK